MATIDFPLDPKCWRWEHPVDDATNKWIDIGTKCLQSALAVAGPEGSILSPLLGAVSSQFMSGLSVDDVYQIAICAAEKYARKTEVEASKSSLNQIQEHGLADFIGFRRAYHFAGPSERNDAYTKYWSAGNALAETLDNINGQLKAMSFDGLRPFIASSIVRLSILDDLANSDPDTDTAPVTAQDFEKSKVDAAVHIRDVLARMLKARGDAFDYSTEVTVGGLGLTTTEYIIKDEIADKNVYTKSYGAFYHTDTAKEEIEEKMRFYQNNAVATLSEKLSEFRNLANAIQLRENPLADRQVCGVIKFSHSLETKWKNAPESELLDVMGFHTSDQLNGFRYWASAVARWGAKQTDENGQGYCIGVPTFEAGPGVRGVVLIPDTLPHTFVSITDKELKETFGSTTMSSSQLDNPVLWGASVNRWAQRNPDPKTNQKRWALPTWEVGTIDGEPVRGAILFNSYSGVQWQSVHTIKLRETFSPVLSPTDITNPKFWACAVGRWATKNKNAFATPTWESGIE